MDAMINGSTGIAVAMATNIPPHNLSEVSRALTHLIEKPDATVAGAKRARALKGSDGQLIIQPGGTGRRGRRERQALPVREPREEDLDPKLLLWDMHRNVDAAAVPPGRRDLTFVSRPGCWTSWPGRSSTSPSRSTAAISPRYDAGRG